jgi:decaprenyl-phosphate phosphoribosyltransferase
MDNTADTALDADITSRAKPPAEIAADPRISALSEAASIARIRRTETVADAAEEHATGESLKMLRQPLFQDTGKGNKPDPWKGPDGLLAAATAAPPPDEFAAAPGRGRIRAMTSLLRPRQWVKNGLVVVAPLAVDPGALIRGAGREFATFGAFTAAASAVYVLNDWLDRDRDRLHPEKRHRPLASGQVDGTGALLLAVVCLLILGGCLLLVPSATAGVVGAYLALNLAYCLRLKHQPLIDVSIVALGFALRVAAGSAAVHVADNADLLICVYCSCLLLSFGKRRHELARYVRPGDAHEHRPALRHYSVALLDNLMMVMLATTVISYALFTQAGLISRHPLLAALTLPFAVFAGARYVQLVTVQDTGGEPVRDLARDRAMLLNATLWLGLLLTGAIA